MKQQIQIQSDELPEGWEFVEMRKICLKSQYGYTAKSSKVKEGPIYLRITDIKEDGSVDFNRVVYTKIKKRRKEFFIRV